ncbi:MAG: phosphoribosyl-ATP diphosphatase [Nitrosomonas sp.]|nr:phosphoribosyl-ATP diphosphatase [Nitrosomonas sp.]MDP1950737.1 phosphoribosyl-ATP diphosphatase [Nitrosomonas sp.]
MTDTSILTRLAETIETRKHADPASSYVAKLLHDGQDKILKKIAEESAETLMASKDGDAQHVVRETADLWFHCLVLLAHHGLKPSDVLDELQRREGIPGNDEKASRSLSDK